MVYGDGLENRCPFYGGRGFESHPLRQFEKRGSHALPRRKAFHPQALKSVPGDTDPAAERSSKSGDVTISGGEKDGDTDPA